MPTYKPTDIAWDGDGDLWVTGKDAVKFDGQNYKTYDSSNSVLPGSGLNTNCVIVDRNDKIWIGVDSNTIPLVKIDDLDSNNSVAYSVTQFLDDTGTAICPNVAVSIKAIENNPKSGDIFASFVCPSDTSYNGLLFYNASSKSWYIFNTSNSEICSSDIRDLKLEYIGISKWFLWIATTSGLSRFDGTDFKNYKTSNSGICSNSVYSLEIDQANHLWIGTSNGICYFDKVRWTVWNSTTNPELISGKILNIVESGNSNIWFMIDPSSADNDAIIYFFDGYNFTKYEYKDDGTTLINPTSSWYGKSFISAPWKTIKNGEVTYPKNLIFLTDDGEIGKIDYVIPHIHATAKFPGADGWDFVYMDPSTEGPNLQSVDKYSWRKPSNVEYLKNVFPSINLDDIFLSSTLRDVLDGKSSKEEYWRNNQVQRILEKKSMNMFDNFEWVISLGDPSYSLESGVKLANSVEGDIVCVGDYKGVINTGSTNNLSSSSVTLTSSVSKGVYVIKYNKAGILQWARSVTPTIEGDISAKSVTVDKYDNVYLVSDNSATGFIQIDKWNSEGDFIGNIRISNTNYRNIGDIKADIYGNLYICGNFKGSLNIGGIILNNTTVNPNGFIAKISANFESVWAKKITGNCSCDELVLVDNTYLYVTGTFTGSLGNTGISSSAISDLYFMNVDSGNGDIEWAKKFAGNSATSFSSPSISVDNRSNILIASTFSGNVSVEGNLLNSDSSQDIFLSKFTPTGKLIWIKRAGGSSGDTVFDVESDRGDFIYITGTFTGSSVFSPDVIVSQGSTDIYLSKFDPDGLLVDVITAGGINSDGGSDIVIDKEDNVYLTGYFNKISQFPDLIVNTSPDNSRSAFIGKIPRERFIPGFSFGNIVSWKGSHSWSWKENKFYENEFEIPLASTVFINPVNTLIPGKKEYVWKLTDSESGVEVITIGKSPYFIWTFTKEGSYDVYCSLQDSNGNIYETEEKGKIRVIDHKNPKAGDLIPEVVNPNDYSLRSNYYSRDDIGFPPIK